MADITEVMEVTLHGFDPHPPLRVLVPIAGKPKVLKHGNRYFEAGTFNADYWETVVHEVVREVVGC